VYNTAVILVKRVVEEQRHQLWHCQSPLLTVNYFAHITRWSLSSKLPATAVSWSCTQPPSSQCFAVVHCVSKKFPTCNFVKS